MDQLFELKLAYATSCVSTALIKYSQISNKGAILNYLKCIRNASNGKCTLNVDMTKFKSWLDKYQNSKEEYPVIYVYADKSEVFLCAPGIIKEGESKFNNAKDLYSFFYQSKDCFTLLNNSLTKDFSAILYHDRFKIEYNTSSRESSIIELSAHYPHNKVLVNYKENAPAFYPLSQSIEDMRVETMKGNYTSASHMYGKILHDFSTPNTTVVDTHIPNTEQGNNYLDYLYMTAGGIGVIVLSVLTGMCVKAVYFSSKKELGLGVMSTVGKGAYQIIGQGVGHKQEPSIQVKAFETLSSVQVKAFETLALVHKSSMQVIDNQAPLLEQNGQADTTHHIEVAH